MSIPHSADVPRLVTVPRIGQPDLGYISFVEGSRTAPFEFRRVYWTYHTPHDVQRGGHAHRALEQLIFAVAGVIAFKLVDRCANHYSFVLDSPDQGLYIPPKTWRDIQFSHNAVLLCLASEFYSEDDYIRSWDEFEGEVLQ